jgi:protoporphyrin/coproporphyrin ferrochelatase
VVERIDEALARFPDPRRCRWSSARTACPVSVIEKGDPYQQQIEETVALVMEQGGWSNPSSPVLSEQSGREPVAGAVVAPDAAASWRRRKRREVCIVPISFVSDHVETLAEIDHHARDEARLLGIERFEMTRGLNDSPTFIQALAAVGDGGDRRRRSVKDRIKKTFSIRKGKRRRLPCSPIER